jgi:hypothetical protein
MSIQGFAGGLMQGYDFMEDQYDRRDRRQRLDRQESRAESREARAQDQYETNKSLALEQREWAEKQRKDQERLNMIRSAQYKVQNGIPLSAEEQETLNVQMQDPKTQAILQNIQKNPKKANQQARNIKLAIEGKADLNKAIEDGNELFKPFIQQGAGKNKRIDGIIPVGKKAYAKLSYEDEDYGTPVKDAPLTTNRSKNDYLVRDLDLGRLYTAADYLDQLSAMAIQLGDTTPIERQAAQEGQMREMGLKLFERGLDREDMAIEHGYGMEKARFDANVELQKEAMKKAEQGLGETPGYIKQAFTEPVLDEEGNPVMQLDKNGNEVPAVRTNQAAMAELADFALQRGHRNWDDAYREFVQVKQQQAQQRQAEIRAKQAQEQAQKKVANTEQLIQGGDIQAAKQILAEYQQKTPEVYQFIMENLSEESRKALQQPEQAQPEKEYTLGKGMQDAKANIGRAGQKAAGLSEWMDSLNFNWKK